VSNVEPGANRRTIGLIHGSWHGAWSWDKLRPELDKLGFDSIPVQLPTRVPGASYEDYADAAASQLEGQRIDLLVAHSGGAHTVPGVVKRLGVGAIGGVVYLGGSLGASGGESPLYTRGEALPWQRATRAFREAMIPMKDGMVAMDMSRARGLFFNDTNDTDARWAMNHMEIQNRPTDEPPLGAHQIDGLPAWYVLNREDRIRDRGMAAWAAGHLGMRLIEMDGDHSPAISRPAELARVLASLTVDNVTQKPQYVPLPRQSSEVNTPWAQPV